MRQGIRYCPDNAAAYNDLGVALVLSGDYTSARIQFDRAIHFDSQYEPAYRNLAHLNRHDSRRSYRDERRDHRSKAKRRDSGSHGKHRRARYDDSSSD